MVTDQIERASDERRGLQALISLYLVASITSISAMALFSALIAIYVIWQLVGQKMGKRQSIGLVRLGIEWRILGFVAIVILGLGLNLEKGQFNWPAVADLTWIPLLYTLVVAFRLQFLRLYMLNILFVIAVVVSIYAITQFFSGYDLLRGRAHEMHQFGGFFRSVGLFNNPMTFAHSFAMLLFLPLSFVFSSYRLPSGTRVLAIVAALFIFLSVVTSQTRGAWIGVVCGVLLVSFLYSKRLAAYAFAGMSVLAALMVSFIPVIRSRVMTVFDLSFDNNSTRIELWRANFEMFQDHPFFGVGYGQNVDLLASYYARLGIDSDFFSHAHNTYIHFLAGTGGFGLLAYLLIFAGIFFSSIRMISNFPKGSLAWTLLLGSIGAQCAFHIGGLTECNFEDSEVNHMFLIFIALTMVVFVDQRNGVTRQELL